MAEYIDREEYCEKHCRCSNEYCDKESCPIWKAPAADVVPVVRCKDCKHSYEGHPYYCEDVVERFCMHGVYRHVTVTDDFFCGYGEKKDGDENGGVR